MILYTFQKTQHSMGGGPISWVCDFIAFEKHSFGSAIEMVEVTIYSNPRLTPKGALQPFRRRFGNIQQPHDAKFPTVQFRRKAKKLMIKWEAQHLTEPEMETRGSPNPNHDIFCRAVQDVYDALDWGLHERLSSKDDFNVKACLAWVKAAQSKAPRDPKALRATLAERAELYLRRARIFDYHTRFNLDWDALHPDAAHLLHHPDLWSETDPRMP